MLYRQCVEEKIEKKMNEVQQETNRVFRIRLEKIGRYWYVKDLMTGDLLKPWMWRAKTIREIEEMI